MLVTAQDLAQAARAVRGMTVAEQAGSVIMASSADAVGTDLVARLHLGGVILMGSRGVIDGTSGGTPSQVLSVTTALQEQAAGAPVLIATDQEYGDVIRLVHGFTDFPGASVLASIPDLDHAAALTRQVAAAAATELLAVGVTVNFAPDADVLPVSGASAIGDRSYGADPERASALVAAAVSGYQGAGVPATLKHFPDIGEIAADTHDTLPTLRTGCAQWDQRESAPMRAGVAAGAALVMTGHVLFPAVGADGAPASISAPVVTGLLKGAGVGGCTGLHFGGVTVTDSLQMDPIADSYSSGGAAWRALAAGEDLLLMPVNPAAAADGIVAAVADGSLAASRLSDAATAVYALRLATARVTHPSLAVVDSAAHRQLAATARAAAG